MKGSAAMAEVIEPYAEALMSLAKDSNLVDQFGEDAAGILAVLAESDELSSLIVSPVFEASQKQAVLRQIFEGQLHKHMFSFLLLLVERKRAAYIPGICQRYQALLRDLKQIVVAEVTAAVELNDDQRQSITDRVKAMTDAQSVELQILIDPSLIGGVIIKVGSQVFDASLSGQLRRMALTFNAS